MLTNFEEITKELTPEELATAKILIKGLKKRTKDNQVKQPEILTGINRYYGSNILNGAKLRKLVNHIRMNGIAPIIATKKGYYMSNDHEELSKQIESLEQRARSIQRAADGLKKFL